MTTSIRALPVLASLLLGACASASISSLAAPESAGRVYKRILVLTPIGDIATRRGMEEAFEGWGHDSGTRFFPAYKIFFPGRTFTPTEVAAILRTNGIDATLVLEPQSSPAAGGFIPPTSKLNCPQWSSITGCGQGATVAGGRDDQWNTFAARLFDVGTGTVTWIATGTGTEGALSGAASVHRAIASRTVHVLAVDHLAAPRTQSVQDSMAAKQAEGGPARGNPLTGSPTP